MWLVLLFGRPPGTREFVLDTVFSSVPLVLLIAGVWFLLRRRAHRTERTSRLARMVDAYERAEETDRDDREG